MLIIEKDYDIITSQLLLSIPLKYLSISILSLNQLFIYAKFQKFYLYMFIYTCIKISIVIFSIDILVFIMIVFLSMSDSKSPDIARVLFFILQHILSLPLSLLIDNLPFYLEYRELPNFIFISLPTNILLQSILCFAIIKVVKWSITTIVGNRPIK